MHSLTVWSFWRLLLKCISLSCFCHLTSSSFPFFLLGQNSPHITQFNSIAEETTLFRMIKQFNEHFSRTIKKTINYILHESRSYCRTVALHCIIVHVSICISVSNELATKHIRGGPVVIQEESRSCAQFYLH